MTALQKPTNKEAVAAAVNVSNIMTTLKHLPQMLTKRYQLDRK